METESLTKVLVINWSHLIYVLPAFGIAWFAKQVVASTWQLRPKIWAARKEAAWCAFWSLAGLSFIGVGVDTLIDFTPNFIRMKTADGTLVPVVVAVVEPETEPEQEIAVEKTIEPVTLPGKWKDLLDQLEKNIYLETTELTLRSFAKEQAARCAKGDPCYLPAAGFEQIISQLDKNFGDDDFPMLAMMVKEELGKFVTPFPLEQTNDAGGTQLVRLAP